MRNFSHIILVNLRVDFCETVGYTLICGSIVRPAGAENKTERCKVKANEETGTAL